MFDNLVIAYGLIILALFLLAAELFLPTFGVLFVLGLAALIAGIAMTFSPASGGSTTHGMVTLIAVFVLIPILGPLLLHYWPKTALGKRFFLDQPEEDDSLVQLPAHLEQLRGRYGKTVSALRPSGMTEFDSKRVDAMSEGQMIDPGVWVKCIDVRAGQVIVRQIDKPPDLAHLDSADLG